MAEIPEHLLKRAAERKAQLAAEANAGAADTSGDAVSPPSEHSEPKVSSLAANASSDVPATPAEEAPVRTGLAAKVPEFLFQRSAKRRAVLSGDAPATSSDGGTAAP
ncbi:MAG TPA: hypothetical protein PKB15_07210, partial [Acidimicrobiia bacterium]|nr:hypothetical protein [Acidimicrobiia bacterium]